jgi:hypothetical protein
MEYDSESITNYIYQVPRLKTDKRLAVQEHIYISFTESEVLLPCVQEVTTATCQP